MYVFVCIEKLCFLLLSLCNQTDCMSNPHLFFLFIYSAIRLTACPLAEPQWTRRKRDVSGELVMRASRGYERVEEDKTAGCMADGLRCNIWERIQSPAKLLYELIKGGHCQGGRKGFQMHEMAWSEGGRLPMPWWLADHQILTSFGAKIANFIVDFHMDWVESLQLPPSDGRHKQLDPSHIQRVLDRLQTIQEVHSEVQIYSAVKIGHSDFNGSQFIHCTPFKSRHINTRMVRICIFLYVFVRIRTYSFVFCLYSYVFVRICTYLYTCNP